LTPPPNTSLRGFATMALLNTVYQPTSAAEAAALLARPHERLALLAGGSRLIADLETRTRRDLDGVIDLSRAGLDRLDVRAGHVHAGAMVTFSRLIGHEIAGSLAGGLLRRAAAGEGPVNLRNVATLGGVVASAETDSELYAALLALGCSVTLHNGAGEQTLPLEELPSDPSLLSGGLLPGGLITAVLIPTQAAQGALARVARTPADRPIVAAVAVRSGAGERVALCGVAPRPVLLGSELAPHDDFKGSGAYRRAMIEIAVQRARVELG
jgi:CO/xanthine dehydrogenase FAD-binding subunit